MDKIKDFFHDFSDVFFAITVASVMFVVLSLNLGNWFDNSSNIVLADEPTNVSEKKDTNLVSEDNDKKVNSENKEESNTKDKDVDQTLTEKENLQAKDNTNPNEKEVQPKDTVINPQIKTVVIPNGTPGSGVAKILKENGLIDDTQNFINTAENLNLAIRLKSGTFKIPTNATVEDMVKIIAGQKR